MYTPETKSLKTLHNSVFSYSYTTEIIWSDNGYCNSRIFCYVNHYNQSVTFSMERVFNKREHSECSLILTGHSQSDLGSTPTERILRDTDVLSGVPLLDVLDPEIAGDQLSAMVAQ